MNLVDARAPLYVHSLRAHTERTPRCARTARRESNSTLGLGYRHEMALPSRLERQRVAGGWSGAKRAANVSLAQQGVGSRHYFLSFSSLKSTCLLTSGSCFMSWSFSGLALTFLSLV